MRGFLTMQLGFNCLPVLAKKKMSSCYQYGIIPTIGMHFDYTIEMKLLFYSPILISKIMEAKGSTT